MPIDVILIILASFYVLFLIAVYYALCCMNKDQSNHDFSLVSIVIAARNEEENIECCLCSILSINYPQEKYEVILVDDGSTDGTRDVISRFCSKYQNWSAIYLDNKSPTETGKISALLAATSKAKGEIIFCNKANQPLVNFFFK